MKITWLGHSCFRIDTGASAILIDPFMTGNPTFEKIGKSIAEVSAGVTHVVLSHGHDDHVGDSVDICKQTGATLVAVFELAMYLNGQGVVNVDPTNTGGTVDHGDFTVSFTDARHSSGTIVDGRIVYLGNPCGLVVKAEGHCVYHMGDTEIMSEMAVINEVHRPDIGMVPIGDRFTMGAKTAALACKKYFDFKTVIPCHYGTFPIIDQTPDAFLAEMAAANVVVAEPGRAMEL